MTTGTKNVEFKDAEGAQPPDCWAPSICFPLVQQMARAPQMVEQLAASPSALAAPQKHGATFQTEPTPRAGYGSPRLQTESGKQQQIANSFIGK